MYVRVTHLINDDIKIVRTPKNMAANVLNLPGMTLQPLLYLSVRVSMCAYAHDKVLFLKKINLFVSSCADQS